MAVAGSLWGSGLSSGWAFWRTAVIAGSEAWWLMGLQPGRCGLVGFGRSEQQFVFPMPVTKNRRVVRIANRRLHTTNGHGTRARNRAEIDKHRRQCVACATTIPRPSSGRASQQTQLPAFSAASTHACSALSMSSPPCPLYRITPL